MELELLLRGRLLLESESDVYVSETRISRVGYYSAVTDWLVARCFTDYAQQTDPDQLQTQAGPGLRKTLAPGGPVRPAA